MSYFSLSFVLPGNLWLSQMAPQSISLLSMNAFKILIVHAYFLQITAVFCLNPRTEPRKKKQKKNIQPALGLKDTLSRNANRANASAKIEAKRLISFVVG